MQARFLAAVLVLALAVTLAPAAAKAADFVGAESCRACHAAAYEAWKESPHARALQSLSPDQQKDGRCLQCHARDLAQNGDPGVTCETCHGAGQFYWPAYVMKDGELARATGLVLPDAKSCTVCHDASSPSLTPFDAAEKLKVIDHWSETRAARKAKKSASTDVCPRRTLKAALDGRPGEGFLARALKPVAGKAPDPVAVAIRTAPEAARRTTARTTGRD